MADSHLTPIEIGLTAAIVAVDGEEPAILVAGDGGKSEPRAGFRSARSIRSTTAPSRSGCAPGSRRRPGSRSAMWSSSTPSVIAAAHARPGDIGPHMVSVGYLALTRVPENRAALRAAGAGFEPWYRFFPWEDWRERRPAILDKPSCRC